MAQDDAISGSHEDLDRSPAMSASPTSPSDSQGSVFECADKTSPTNSPTRPLAADSLVPSKLPSVQTEDVGIELSSTNFSDGGTVKPNLILDDDETGTNFDAPTENGHHKKADEAPGKKTQSDRLPDDPGSPLSVTHTSTSGLLPQQDNERAKSKESNCCTIL